MADECVSGDIVRVLEEAAQRYLAGSPEWQNVFMLQVDGARRIRPEQRDATFWRWVQAILDTFFAQPERAAICERLLELAPEDRAFRASALAERRLRQLLDAARVRRVAGVG